jgi:putative ABC transport system permease protein
MFRNHLKTAWRNLVKRKGFSFINIFGLAVGLTCFMLIAVFVYNELSYDNYPAEAENIYRVELSVTGNGNVVVYPDVDVAVGQGIKHEFPEVEAVTRIFPARDFVKYGVKEFREEHLSFADSNFLQMFSIPLIQGDPASALVQPNSIVVSKDFAKKYFGNESPLGKTLSIGTGGAAFKVTGMIDRVPDNTHFHFDAFISRSTFPTRYETWSNLGNFTYIRLNKNADPKKLEAKFPALVAAHVVPEVQHDMGVSLAEAQKSVNTFVFSLRPLRDIHLYSHTKYELEPNGDIKYVYIFSVLALFILLLACVNFTNLSTARASRRAREVGVRKVLGSEKRQLIFQFLAESVLITFFALLFAYALTGILLPYFNHIAGKDISYRFFLDYRCVSVLLLVSLAVGIVSGIYPAFFLSGFHTIQVLKGAGAAPGSQKKWLRSGLIIFQFFVSTGLIIATLIVFQQLHFMQHQKLGYDKEQVLYLQNTQLLGMRDARNAFKQRLLQDTRIVNASVGTNLPGNPDMDGTQVYPREKQNSENGSEIHANIFHVDYDYIPTLGISMARGRNFSKEFPTDSFAVVINEAAVQELGWSGTDPIGKTIVTSGQHEYTVIGVTQDFHYASLRQKVAPLMMELSYPGPGLIVRIKTTDVSLLLADIKKQWDRFNPGAPFAYYFLDEHFAQLYAAEERTRQIFSSFALIAILIASLGLFGLSAFVIEQRTKEIGIRKVLGASVRQVLTLVSKEFIFLIIIACIIAIPVTWWAMNVWLQEFAYRITIGPWVFGIAGILAIVIAIVTISFQAIRAALANPVKSLRSE